MQNVKGGYCTLISKKTVYQSDDKEKCGGNLPVVLPLLFRRLQLKSIPTEVSIHDCVCIFEIGVRKLIAVKYKSIQARATILLEQTAGHLQERILVPQDIKRC